MKSWIKKIPSATRRAPLQLQASIIQVLKHTMFQLLGGIVAVGFSLLPIANGEISDGTTPSTRRSLRCHQSLRRHRLRNPTVGSSHAQVGSEEKPCG